MTNMLRSKIFGDGAPGAQPVFRASAGDVRQPQEELRFREPHTPLHVQTEEPYQELTESPWDAREEEHHTALTHESSQHMSHN